MLPRVSIKLRIVLPLLALMALGAVLPAVASAATPSITWVKSVSLENPGHQGSFDAVSCAINTKGKQLCVAADESGHVWWTRAPWKRAAGTWHRITVDTVKGASLTGISCPTISFCAVVDNKGYVMRSHDPSGGAKRWSKPVHADSTAAAGGGLAGFAGISCPSASLCVAVDNAGQVVTATNPAGGASAWTAAVLPGSPTATSVSCPTITLCVIGGSERLYSASPTGGASAWRAAGAPEGLLASISCPTATACIGVGYGDGTTGLASATATPTGTARSWVNTVVNTNVPAGNVQLLDSVSCAGVGLCVAVDGADNAFDTTTPLTGAWAPITSARPTSTSTWSAISCDIKNCVVVDSRGFVTGATVKGVTAAVTTTPTTTTTTTTTTGTTKTTTTGTTKKTD